MASESFSKWLGGPNFVWARQFGSGRSNDGAGKKKFGNAGMRRRIRFNPNPTACAHPNCQIAKQSAADKAKYVAARGLA